MLNCIKTSKIKSGQLIIFVKKAEKMGGGQLEYR